MGGTIESPIEVTPCGCGENVQLRHQNNSLQEQLQYITDVVGKDVSKNEPMSLMKQNETLGKKNDHLEADNKKLRQEVEILKGSHQLHADIMNRSFTYSSEPFGKDEPTEKKEMSEADVQTEDFGHLEDGCTVCATVELIEVLYQKLKEEQVVMNKELTLITQKIALVTERLEIELETKQALQTENDRLKADQQKLLLRELRDKQRFEELDDRYRKAVEQNEKLGDEVERLFTFESHGALDQTVRSLADSLEAIAKQNEIGHMIVKVQKNQEPRTGGFFKPLLMGFLLTVTIVLFASLVSISLNSTDPRALYDRHQYI